MNRLSLNDSQEVLVTMYKIDTGFTVFLFTLKCFAINIL